VIKKIPFFSLRGACALVSPRFAFIKAPHRPSPTGARAPCGNNPAWVASCPAAFELFALMGRPSAESRVDAILGPSTNEYEQRPTSDEIWRERTRATRTPNPERARCRSTATPRLFKAFFGHTLTRPEARPRESASTQRTKRSFHQPPAAADRENPRRRASLRLDTRRVYPSAGSSTCDRRPRADGPGFRRAGSNRGPNSNPPPVTSVFSAASRTRRQ